MRKAATKATTTKRVVAPKTVSAPVITLEEETVFPVETEVEQCNDCVECNCEEPFELIEEQPTFLQFDKKLAGLVMEAAFGRVGFASDWDGNTAERVGECGDIILWIAAEKSGSKRKVVRCLESYTFELVEE